MRVAALYDIHGNLPALEAVLEEVRAPPVEHAGGRRRRRSRPWPWKRCGAVLDYKFRSSSSTRIASWRRVQRYGVSRSRTPWRFGLFAAMPLPDLDATLARSALTRTTPSIPTMIGAGHELRRHGWARSPFTPATEELIDAGASWTSILDAADLKDSVDFLGVGPDTCSLESNDRGDSGVTFSGDAVRSRFAHLVAWAGRSASRRPHRGAATAEGRH